MSFLVQVEKSWLNPEAIELVIPLRDDVSNPACQVQLRSGQKTSFAITAKALADLINSESSH